MKGGEVVIVIGDERGAGVDVKSEKVEGVE